MKPNMTGLLYTLMSGILAQAIANADYDGGQIMNDEIIHTGNIVIDYTNPGEDAHGAVEWSQGTGDTRLTGNIMINAGKGYESDETLTHPNHGVYILSGAENSNIILEASSTADRILMNIYTIGTVAIRNDSASSLITVDASRSSSPIEIHSTNSSTTSVGSSMIYAQGGGRINIKGDLFITTAQKAGRAMGCASDGLINVDGHLTFTSTGEEARGVTTSGGSIVITKGATINTSGNAAHGVFSYGSGGSIKFEAPVSVNATGKGSWGIYAGGGAKVELNGGNIASNAQAFYADSNGTIQGAGKYTFTGDIHANRDSLIELSMQNGSVFTGKATYGTGTNTVNISLDNRSQWNVTANSALSNLKVDGSSWLAFNLQDSEAMTFTNITAASVSLSEGAVLQLIGITSDDFNAINRSVGEFTSTLFKTGSLTADGVKLVTEDNYELIFTNNADGSFTVTGVKTEQLFIPEPCTATLGVLGLLSLLIKRRRS